MKSSNDKLSGLKFGLGAVMFIYVCLAIYLPVLIFNLINRKKFTNKSLQQSTGHINHGHDHNDDDLNQNRMNELNQKNLHTMENMIDYKNFKTKWFHFKWTEEKQTKLLSRANCLAAGAFLSVGFMDIFMDTIEQMDEAKGVLNINTEFPLASLVVLIGFLLILGIEQISLELYNRNQTNQYNLTTNSHNTTENLQNLNPSNEIYSTSPIWINNDDHNNQHDDGHSEHNHDCLIKSENLDMNWLSILTLLCALSLHSVFEGVAVGLKTTISELLTLFGALSVHKLVIAISIGLNLANNSLFHFYKSVDHVNNKKRIFKFRIVQILATLLFAIASPIGVLVGWSVCQTQEKSVNFLIIQSILQGLACGTFFYVVFCELLPKEFEQTKSDKPGKFLFLIIGFVIIGLIINFTPHD